MLHLEENQTYKKDFFYICTLSLLNLMSRINKLVNGGKSHCQIKLLSWVGCTQGFSMHGCLIGSTLAGFRKKEQRKIQPGYLRIIFNLTYGRCAIRIHT